MRVIKESKNESVIDVKSLAQACKVLGKGSYDFPRVFDGIEFDFKTGLIEIEEGDFALAKVWLSKYAKAYELLAKAISTATEEGLYDVKTGKKK